MTITSATSRVSYTGTGGITDFSYPALFNSSSDLKVYVLSADGTAYTLQALNTDYTVSGAGSDSGGTVSFTTAPALNTTVIIYRDPAVTQTTDYNDNDPFPASATEGAFDKACMIDQRSRELVERAIHLADGDAAADLILPTAANRASKVLGFDASGLPTAVTAAGAGLISSAMATAVNASTLGAGLADLGLTVYTTGGTSTAYTLTTTQAFASLAAMDGQSLLIKMSATSGASPTLAVDGLTAKPINTSHSTAAASGALLSGSTYRVTYINASNEFIVDGGVRAFAEALSLTSTLSVAGKASFTSTDSMAMANGTTGQRNGSPSAGDVRYNSTLTNFEYYNGSAWIVLGQQLQARVSTQFDVTSNNTLANVTGLSVSLIAGRTYSLRAILYVTSNASGGAKVAVSGTATATAIRYRAKTFTSTTLSTHDQATTLGTAVGASTSAVTAIEIDGTITVNAAGTLTIQFAQNASFGTASSVLVGSHMVVCDIP
jgi:hypothetical protein